MSGRDSWWKRFRRKVGNVVTFPRDSGDTVHDLHENLADSTVGAFKAGNGNAWKSQFLDGLFWVAFPS